MNTLEDTLTLSECLSFKSSYLYLQWYGYMRKIDHISSAKQQFPSDSDKAGKYTWSIMVRTSKYRQVVFGLTDLSFSFPPSSFD